MRSVGQVLEGQSVNLVNKFPLSDPHLKTFAAKDSMPAKVPTYVLNHSYSQKGLNRLSYLHFAYL